MFLVSNVDDMKNRELQNVKEYEGQTRQDIQKEIDTWKNLETQPISSVDIELYKALQNQSATLYFAFYQPDDVLSGFLSCLVDKSRFSLIPKVIILTAFIVHPSMRRHGIGKEMFENFVKHLRFMNTQKDESMKLETCAFDCDDKNLAFWTNQGCFKLDRKTISFDEFAYLRMIEEMTSSKFLMFKL